MTISEFFKKFNLNATYFAAMASVGKRTIDRYAQGISIANGSKWRIETAMNAIIKMGVPRPKFGNNFVDIFEWNWNRRKQTDWYDKVANAIREERA